MAAVEMADTTHKNYPVHSSQKLKVYFVLTQPLMFFLSEMLISGIAFVTGPKTLEEAPS